MPYVFFENDSLDDEEIGYIYVFKKDNKFIHNGGSSLQYRCHEKIIPIEIIPIKFKDYKDFYNIEIRKKVK